LGIVSFPDATLPSGSEVAVLPEKVSEAFGASFEPFGIATAMMDRGSAKLRETRLQRRNYPIVARRSFIAAE
jgi:hypothetical protein